MPRVKGGKNKSKKRSGLLKKTKGYRYGRKSKKRAAKTAWVHAGKYAFEHRKDRKNNQRRQWQIMINAAVREHDLSYSDFIHRLKENEIELDRKVLAKLAKDRPETFERIVEAVK